MDLTTLLLLQFALLSVVSGNMVFEVHHKFKSRQRSLSAFKAHDDRRHARFLYSAVDFQLGGNGRPSEAGLYYAKIGLGSPSKDYHVQVDTGSDILWVNCFGCSNCPTKSDLGIELTTYDLKGSSTGEVVTCDQDFCSSMFDGIFPGCKSDIPCQYSIVYGDGSSTSGYYVKDYVQLDRVSGNHQTTTINGSVIFGCGAKQAGGFGKTSDALDGILGFGQANSSMISQLASSGKVKRKFAHCLDGEHGGGIFAIGEIVEPKVNTTPMLPNMAHYNVVMKTVTVGGDVLDLRPDVYESGEQRGTIIDSGTTLTYLPGVVYESVMNKIMEKQPGLKLHIVQDQFSCFYYNGNVDDAFPTVTFGFKGSLTLTVYAHDYLFQVKDDVWCFGWMNGGLMKTKDGKDLNLLGDLVLMNKLVLYDIENQALGWVEYNCSSSIKMKDALSKAVYSVDAQNSSSASNVIIGRITFVFIIIAMLLNFTY